MSTKQLNPAPLGLAAFAMTTTALSLFILGVLPTASGSVVVPLALAYGGIIQVIVGWWEGKSNNTFGFVAFLSYGAFWLYVAFLRIFGALHIISVDVPTQGAVLLLWGFFTFYLWIAALKLNKTTNIIFLLLTLAFVVLGIGDITGIPVIQTVGGLLALLTAIAAWYGSLAAVINDTFGKAVLPLGKPLK
jgi:succinate-acetate transporter protein